MFADLSDRRITQMGQTISGNVLNNAKIPQGVAASVTGFVVQGSTQVIKPGSLAISLSDLKTNNPMGKLTMRSDGSYVFEPAPGYIGPAPAVSVYLESTDKQTAVSSLALEVLPSGSGSRAGVDSSLEHNFYAVQLDKESACIFMHIGACSYWFTGLASREPSSHITKQWDLPSFQNKMQLLQSVTLAVTAPHLKCNASSD
jgi:hypothetical protein